MQEPVLLRRPGVWLAAGLLALVALACDPARIGSDATADSDAAVGRADAPDASASFDAAELPESPDATLEDAPDAADAPPEAEPLFAVGTNPFGVSSPAQFEALTDGGPLEVQLGSQGAWMVVLAVRTAGILSGKLDLEARLWVGGVDAGGVIRTGLQPVPGGDGYVYLYSLPLIVDGPEIAGSAANLVVDATGSGGGEAHASLELELTGGR